MSVKFFGRTRARSQALQLLFQAEATNRSVLEVLDGDYTLSEGPLDEYAQSLAVGADGIRDDLDDIIAAYSKDWAIDRMPSVDRNLLRISLYEILEVPEVDVAVAINEVVDLARAYCGDDSPSLLLTAFLVVLLMTLRLEKTFILCAISSLLSKTFLKKSQRALWKMQSSHGKNRYI